MNELKDVFICHASEDKPEVVKPLIAAFKREGISYWYDEAEIKWGQSIPVFVGTDKARKEIFRKYSLLNDKLYLIWEDDVKEIVDALKNCLGRANKISKDNNLVIEKPDYDIPIPKMPKEFSQLDKDRFIRSSFDIIRKYFKKALNKLKEKYSNLDSELVEISNFKFVCSIYQNGDLLNKCKIWIGGPLSEDSIAYNEGSSGYENDSSFNDWLTVNDDGFKLGLTASGFSLNFNNDNEGKILSSEEAAKYLWVRFANPLTFF